MRADVLVLCYHAVSERWPATLSVTPKRLHDQIRLLLDRGYRPTTFHEAVTSPPATRTLAVTFDDAFRSVIEVALPVLTRLSAPATVFVPTSFPDANAPMTWPGIDGWLGGPHQAELRCMSWDELRRLNQAGWEIGSHTHTHPRLPTLDDAALDLELGRSREICTERIGKPCRSLAYPFGAHDERVIAATGRAGYSAAGTLPARIHPASALRWPRIGIYHSDTAPIFRAKVSRAMRSARSRRIWAAADAARRKQRDRAVEPTGPGEHAGPQQHS